MFKKVILSSLLLPNSFTKTCVRTIQSILGKYIPIGGLGHYQAPVLVDQKDKLNVLELPPHVVIVFQPCQFHFEALLELSQRVCFVFVFFF